jgi:hypothetical protein
MEILRFCFEEKSKRKELKNISLPELGALSD